MSADVVINFVAGASRCVAILACMVKLWQAGSSSNVLMAGASRCLLLGWCRK